MKARIYKALQRLARSSWGKQGVGRCPNFKVRRELRDLGFAKDLAGSAPRIMYLTIRGFRALHKEQVKRQPLSGNKLW